MRKTLISAIGAVLTLAAAAFGEVVFTTDVARDGDGVSHLEIYGRRVTSRPLDAETGRAYVLSGEFRAESGTPELSFGLEMYDDRDRMLRAFEYTRLPESCLRLSAASEKGARELQVPGCGKWDLKLGDLMVAEKHPRTPLKIAKIKDDRILVLAGKLPFDLPEGAAVALHCGAPPFSATWRRVLDGNWVRIEKTLPSNGGFFGGGIWPGTRQVRIFVNASPDGKVCFRKLRFAPVADDAARGGIRYLEFHPCGSAEPCPGGIRVRRGGGLRTVLRERVDRIAQLEMLVTADAPGMLETVWRGTDGSRRFELRRAAPVFPDGKPHWMIFRPDWSASADAEVRQLELRWNGADPVRLSVELARPTAKVNLFPGAETAARGAAHRLDHLSGGRKYRLKWRNGTAPSSELRCFGADSPHPVAILRFPAGQPEQSFALPTEAVRGEFRIGADGDGTPSIVELPAAAPHWHGEWIWSQTDSGPHFATLWFEREFELGDAPVDDAALAVAADDSSFVYVNGRPAGAGGNHLQSERLDVAGLLRPGRNKLTIKVFNAVSFGGLICDLHIRQNGRSRFVSSGPEWKYAPGGDTPPNRIDRPVVALGALGTARWNWRLPCRYTGPRAKLEDVSVEEHAFSARCTQLPEPLPRQLRFRVALPDGVTYPLMLDVRIGRKGNFRRFEYVPPFPVNREAGQLYLDDDRFLPLAAPIGTVPAAGKAPGLRRACRIRHGGRLKIGFRGKIMEPFFWALPARFQRAWTARTLQVAAAREAGFDSYALLTDFTEFWRGENDFDFTALDRKAEQLLSLNPYAVFLLQIGCFMPDWWLQAHPDDVSARFDGKPRDRTYERQALASKRWLRDARIPLAALTEHVRNASWGDRVWGANVAENTNWEWFWWHGRGGKPYVTGASPADAAAFRALLRRKYATDAKLAAHWGDPAVTLDTAEMPPEALHRRGTIGTLLDTKRDRRLMDWFEFRNIALAEAVIGLCRSLKEFSGGAWLTGAYYGSFVSQCCGVGYPIQDAGHNGFPEVARSPYVDFVRAPASYRLRALGQSDAVAQPWDTFLCRDKIVYIECDMRTALKFDPVAGDAPVCRPATTAQTVEIMNRMFGMMCATGCSYYWYDIADGSFLDPVLIRTLKRQREIYAALPPVAKLTPPEIAMIGDRDSVYRTKRNNGGDAILPALAFPLMSGLPKLGAPYRVGCIDDLLDGTLPPCRFYIMFNALMMSAETRQKLMERLDREQASVLWLYAPGAFYPERGPEAGYCADFLGLKMRMENIRRRPVLELTREWGGNRFDGLGRNTAPWFIPESGFDEAIGRDERGAPVVVTFRRGGAAHYFSALPELPPQLLRRMAERAGVHFYVPAGSADPVWIGNDTIALHAASDGEKRLFTPPGTKLRRLAGCVGSEELSSGESWYAEAGRTCVFQVVRAN